VTPVTFIEHKMDEHEPSDARSVFTARSECNPNIASSGPRRLAAIYDRDLKYGQLHRLALAVARLAGSSAALERYAAVKSMLIGKTLM
jgi:hypothetical protein